MRFTQSLLLATLLNLTLSLSVFAASPDWSVYAKALQSVKTGNKHDTPLNVVDYSALKKSGQLEAAYQVIKAFPVKSLASKEEKLAFYINTYNILALKMVLDNLPVDSIKDVGNVLSPVWKKTAGVISEKDVSLDAIENDVKRKMGEPRIHFAIVCASVSCPDLRTEPYTAEKLNIQLDDQVKSFLNNAKKGLNDDGKVIHVSKIFDWFEKDFKTVGGIEAFIRQHHSGLSKEA
ncbi:MAG: DUF547 domain-containing protein, partial [Methylococcales bacterium]|nr:DUF547 domain-containing protein [Methylococcales bacterium]